MRKAICIALTLLLVPMALIAGPEKEGPYEDGIYYAEMDEFDRGLKYFALLEVEDGNIVSADWNALREVADMTKDELSKAGMYPIVESGGAQAPWHEQGELAEAWLIEKQDPSLITYSDDEGHTDAITGVSIHVIEFFELAEEALAAGPVKPGPYTNGAYHAEEPEFNRGVKYYVNVLVVNGNIASVDWNAYGEAEDAPDKDTLSKDGGYGIVTDGGAQAEWHVQAMAAEAYLIETQDPAKITYIDEEGHTDAITGCSIAVAELFELAAEALASAK